MKKLSIVQGVQTAGLILIALGVTGAISFSKTNSPINSSNEVLSETTTNVMNMFVYYGQKTISELSPTESGYPNIVKGGGAAIRIDLSPVPPEGTTVTLTTNDSCVLFNDAESGGLFGQSKTDTINAFYTIAIGAVDDSIYEGEHFCKLIASLSSPSADFNGQQQKLTFTVTDNDPKPEGYDESKKTTDLTTNKTITTQTDVSKLSTPMVKFVDNEGLEIEKNESETITFKEKEPIYLKGNTIANGEVKLYIYSELQTATVTADDEGNWAYTIESIEPGDHRVEIEVTDPKTGETSERQEVLAFQVAQTEQVVQPITTLEESIEETNSTSGLYLVAGVSVGLLLIAILGTVIWKKKHPHQIEAANFSPEDINNNIV